MKPCLRISKKVRDRVFHLWCSRPDLCFEDAAAQLGYSPTELTRLTRRWVRARSRAYRLRFPKPAEVKP
jgi:hypothetical protein